MRVGGSSLELKGIKKEPNIALATNEKKLNLYAKQSYHIQGLSQAKCGFWLSVIGSIAGFIIIVIFLFKLKDGNTINAAIGIVSGTIIEVISVLFFAIASNANKRVNNSFEKLRVDSNIVNAIELCKDIEDIMIKDELKVKLALHLVGIKEEYICKKSKSICSVHTKEE